MQGFYALVFGIAWFFGVTELALISNNDALNMPLVCDYYLANKHTGFNCITTDVRFTGAMFIVFALVTLLLSVKSKSQIIFILAGFVSVTVLLASVIRIIYFLQGHATNNYFYWTIGMFFFGGSILYFIKKIRFENSENVSRLKDNNLEMQRLELEIEERKKENEKPRNKDSS
jgi:uncharacterized membrane protein YbhN (UPF0104 family)